MTEFLLGIMQILKLIIYANMLLLAYIVILSYCYCLNMLKHANVSLRLKEQVDLSTTPPKMFVLVPQGQFISLLLMCLSIRRWVYSFYFD